MGAARFSVIQRAAAFLAAPMLFGVTCRAAPDPPAPLDLPAAGKQAPFALIVESKEQMGCVVDQRLLENAGPEVRLGITLAGGTASEDSEKRPELYLGFDATEPTGLRGWLVFRIWVEPTSPGAKAQAILTRPSVDWSPIGWSLNLRASGQGVLRLAAGWVQTPDLQSIWRTCPEADLREVFQGRFMAYAPLDVTLKPYDRAPLAEDAKPLQVHFDKVGLARIAEIVAAMDCLDVLASQFGSAESKWLWREERVTRNALKSGLGKAPLPLQALVRPDSGTPIATDETGFVPALRFRLALLTKTGQKVGAEVAIGPLHSRAPQAASGS